VPTPGHSAQLNWTQSASPTFAYYSIFRSTSPGVTPASDLVTTVSNRTTLSFQDTNLAVCGQTYYYRVLVWETNGLHNWGLADTSYRTAWGQRVSAFPYTDSLEAGDANWACDWPWGITGARARAGTHSLTDSPDGNYANNTDASATLRVYLNGLSRPLLSFWQFYSLELNRDFGFVEVSGDNGTNWSRLAGITGYGGTNWQQQQQLDLTPYAGVDLLIRFRLKSNGSVQDDGWYIDDVSITDNAQVAGYPFYDSMDNPGSATNWLSSAAWQWVGGSAQTNAAGSWQCRVGDNAYNPGGAPNYDQGFLTLAGR
jgi:bacillopeptidase F